LAFISGCLAADPKPQPGSVAKSKSEDGDRATVVNGQPFYIKGAGLEFGDQENSPCTEFFRTWRTENGVDGGQKVLDRALKTVFSSLRARNRAERRGLTMTTRLLSPNRWPKSKPVLSTDHPAMLLWEWQQLNLNAKNPRSGRRQ
jgi:hypothetical protein